LKKIKKRKEKKNSEVAQEPEERERLGALRPKEARREGGTMIFRWAIAFYIYLHKALLILATTMKH
jgi:hypothetical protein